MSTAGEIEAKVKSKGKRKIRIAKIEDKSQRQVTFSKRRSGLFKKAAELCTLCDARVAIFTFSEAGRLFSFGHPNVDHVVNQYLHGYYTLGSSSVDPENDDDHHFAMRRQSNKSCNKIIHHKIREEKRRKDVIMMEKLDMCDGDRHGFWWDEPIEELGLEELELYMASLKVLRDNVVVRLGNLFNSATYSSPQMNIDLYDINQVSFMGNPIFMGDANHRD